MSQPNPFETKDAFHSMLGWGNHGEVGRFQRSGHWMEIAGTELEEPYAEALDLWSVMIDDTGRLTDGGFVAANRLEEPTIDEYFEERFDLDPVSAEAVVSRAFWDLLYLRRIPTTNEVNN